MRDYNFFSPYIETKSGTGNKKNIYVTVIIAAIIAGALFLYFYNWYKLQAIKKETTKIEAFLNSQTTKNSMDSYNSIEQKVKILGTYQNIIEEAVKRIEASDKIKSSLLQGISQVMPKNVFLNVINVSREFVQIEGVSSDRTAIAEFVYNLKNNKVFNTVLIGYINEENAGSDSYIFTLICKLEVMNNNEAK